MALTLILNRRRFLQASAASVAALALLRDNSGQSSSLAEGTNSAVSALQPRSIAFGSTVPGAPWDLSKLSELEAAINRHLAVLHWYQWWGGEGSPSFDASLLARVRDHGSTPMITWEPWSGDGSQNPFPLQRISAGEFDAHVDSWARGLKAYGHSVLLRFAHEMNLDQYPWGSPGQFNNQSADYVAAYRHVHDRFRTVGVTNVKWVWCPNFDVGPAYPVPLSRFYPGHDYVDWLALDVYNQAPGRRFPSLSDLLRPAYRQVAALHPSKPIMLAEFGSVEEAGDKAAWITRAAGTDIPQQFSRLQAVVAFDDGDYSLNTSPAVSAACRSVFGGPTYGRALTL